jgi:hypothetical protein
MTRRASTCRHCCRLVPYLVLLRVGFAMPASLLRRRCALTAPFHPYPAAVAKVCAGRALLPASAHRSVRATQALTTTAGRYIFCGTFRPTDFDRSSRTLSGTLLSGVRTFLPAHSPPPVSMVDRRAVRFVNWRGRMGGAIVRSGCLLVQYRAGKVPGICRCVAKRAAALEPS